MSVDELAERREIRRRREVLDVAIRLFRAEVKAKDLPLGDPRRNALFATVERAYDQLVQIDPEQIERAEQANEAALELAAMIPALDAQWERARRKGRR